MTAHRTKYYDGTASAWKWRKRAHSYDGQGRLVGTALKNWTDGQQEPAGDRVEHTYAGGRFVQNTDGTNYGAVWHFAGAQNSHGSALKSPNADTASQTGYNLSDNSTPQRRTFLNPTSEGNQRHQYGQGKMQSKDATGGGTNWYLGEQSAVQTGSQLPVESRLFYDGTMAGTDLSRATDAREKGRIGITGSVLSYAGSYGRVTADSLGRDVNPLGRGDGMAYVAGAMRTGFILSSLPFNFAIAGSGSNINNGDKQLDINGGSGNPSLYGSSHVGPCCKPLIRNIRGLNQLDEPSPCPICSSLCSHEEWGNNFKGCKKRFCECIACGCPHEYSMVVCGCGGGNCAAFNACGCQQFGTCISARWEGGECIPGRMENIPDSESSNVPGVTALYRYRGFKPGHVYKGSDITPIHGKGCEKYRALLESAMSEVCKRFLRCKCLPPKSRECLINICRNLFSSVYIVCDSLECANEGLWGRNAEGSCLAVPPTIILCIPNIAKRATQAGRNFVGALIHVLAHELMHACDCAKNSKSRASNTRCQAVVSFGDDAAGEGFATVCTAACISSMPTFTTPCGDEIPGFDYPLADTNGPVSKEEYCCRCQECGE